MGDIQHCISVFKIYVKLQQILPTFVKNDVAMESYFGTFGITERIQNMIKVIQESP